MTPEHLRQWLSVTELAEQVGITMANISVLKIGKAKVIRFSTLEAVCEALECQPGDILEYRSCRPPTGTLRQTGIDRHQSLPCGRNGRPDQSNLITRLGALALGATFNALDLVAYAAGSRLGR